MAVTVTGTIGGTVTVTLSASGDTASPQNIITAGLGTAVGNRGIQIASMTKVVLQIAQGAIYDDSEWVYNLLDGASLRFNESYGTGTWRSGYRLEGSTLVKCKGATINYINFDNALGGRSIGQSSGTPPNYPTNKPIVQWNDVAWVHISGSNRAAELAFTYAEHQSGDIVLDYFGDGAGANAGIGGSFGSIEKVTLYRCIGGLRTGADTNSLVQIGKFEYFSLPTGNTTGTNPDIKWGFPNNLPATGFAPIFYRDPSTTFLGANTPNNEIVDDPIFPITFPIMTNNRQFNNASKSRIYRRTVKFEFNDSNAFDLLNVTLYINSNSNVMVNAVQPGDFSQPLNYAYFLWNTGTGYRDANVKIDTRVQNWQARKYGYIEQKGTYNIEFETFSLPLFMLNDASLSGISESTASAITTAGINWSTKTITPTADLTYDQINARIAWELAQTANSAQADPRTIVGNKLSLSSGWSLIINNGITITEGTNITILFTPTITLNGNGQINAIYQTTEGTSTIWEFGSIAEPVLAGTSLAIYDNAGVTKYYNAVTVDGVYRYYIAPQAVGETYTYAIEKYGTKRESGTFPSNAGGILFYVPSYSEDVGITETNRATVQAYTTLSTTSQIYDATANFRLSETGIKLGQLVARDGLYLDFGTYNVKLKDDASAIVGVASGTITYKALVVNASIKYNAMKATPPATITVTDNELINVAIEDANGDSQLTILGGDNLGYELWKVTTSTPTDDYATGTLLTTLATNVLPYRFIGISGYDIVGRDISSGVRRRSSMEKGVYTQAFYVGDQIQLATNAPQLEENNQKLEELTVEIQSIKGLGWETTTDSLKAISDNIEQQGLDLTADLTIINNGVKKASKFIPHNTSL